MRNTYYEVTATSINGVEEVMFGSFDRADCTSEVENEKDSWKDDGYRKIKITSRETVEEASSEVYETVTAKEIFQSYAPNFNFELNAEELVELGLERGFLTKVGEDKFLINKDY